MKQCRVCGKAVKGYAHSVNKEHRNLLAVAGIGTSQDRCRQLIRVAMSERQHYVLSNGSPTKRAVLHANVLHDLREEGDQESRKIHVVGQKKMESGHYISTYSPSALPATW